MGDERGKQQEQATYQQNRYENQQGPMVNYMAENYGRGSEANWGDYNDIMGKYRNIYGAASGTGGEGGGGGATGGGGFAPSLIGYKDPFNSYAGFQDFSTTGGYSRGDIANMRSRGISPIRAAYANAEREMGRQRSLQGGYSPNAFASLARMAREQGQGTADATQNVEAGLAEARNKGRLAGLSGMSDIEKQRLAADLEVAKFNASAQMSAGASGSASRAAAEAANRADQFKALSGMTSLYGTTPGMSETFGNQLLSGVSQGGNFGLGLLGQQNQAAQLPGRYDTTMSRIGDIANIGMNAAYPWLNQNQNQQQASGVPPLQGGNSGEVQYW